MHTHILRAALAAVVVLLPVRSKAQTSIPAARIPGDSAQVMVGELLSHHQQLSLTSGQVQSLTALAVRIREDRGRLQIVGFDRVPGKSVPRFRLLTADQRVEADKILCGGKLVKTARR